MSNSSNEIKRIYKDLKTIERLCLKLSDKLEDDKIDNSTIDWQRNIYEHRLAPLLSDAAFDSRIIIRDLEKELKKRKEEKKLKKKEEEKEEEIICPLK